MVAAVPKAPIRSPTSKQQAAFVFLDPNRFHGDCETSATSLHFVLPPLGHQLS